MNGLNCLKATFLASSSCACRLATFFCLLEKLALASLMIGLDSARRDLTCVTSSFILVEADTIVTIVAKLKKMMYGRTREAVLACS